MLAQSFKSADQLGITEPQKSALMKTLVLLETGKLTHVTGDLNVKSVHSELYTGHFSIRAWAADTDCGTVRCIGGTAEAVGHVKFDNWSHGGAHFPEHPRHRLYNLFSPPLPTSAWGAITDAQAAAALRSYLTTGNAKWHEAVSPVQP